MTTYDKLLRAIQAIPGMSVGDAMWYSIVAGIAYLFFHVLFKQALHHRRISSRPDGARQISREILYSLQSLAIFGVVGGIIYFAAMCGWTQFYRPIDKYGWTYYVISILLMIVVHDAYFYWTHRLMHHRRLFKLFHRTHHLSVSPTPWAAYAFSPLEAFVQGGIGLVIALAIPIHPSAFLPFMLWQITFNVLGHCGYEIFPNSFLRSPIGKFLNSPTHHGLHHEKFRGNYSLYFNVWDRWCGTNHATYEERFDRATSGGRVAMPLTLTIESSASDSASEDTISASGVFPAESVSVPLSRAR